MSEGWRIRGILPFMKIQEILIRNPDLQGQYAIALKSYLAPTTGVYGIIINAFKDIITAHRDNFMLYKAQYKNIMYNEDGEINSPSDQMETI